MFVSDKTVWSYSLIKFTSREAPPPLIISLTGRSLALMKMASLPKLGVHRGESLVTW
jgi:hypothetical protein